MDGIAPNANNYSLPAATASSLGGVKIGSGLSIDSNGILTSNGNIDTNALKIAILEADNPIGHVRIESNNTNPATYLGFGTWTLIGAGRTIVGINTSDSDFNTVNKTGGEKTHRLTYRDWETDRKSTRLNSSHSAKSRMPSSA